MSDPTPAKIDAQAYARTLTGWDEIAIEKMFRAHLDEMSANMSVRALHFTRARRAGVKDGEAFRAAMDASQGELREVWAGDGEGGQQDQGKAGGPDSGPTSSSAPASPTPQSSSSA